MTMSLLIRASAGHLLRPALAILFVVVIAAACQAAAPAAPVATSQVISANPAHNTAAAISALRRSIRQPRAGRVTVSGGFTIAKGNLPRPLSFRQPGPRT